ncbi:hypothetical protein EPUS_03311 [Endocarpon pusillum Z07020]|uniref:Prokaryotic-type class I peptide chain release factors domain-containing protein n=1 Tax=Endocarpon pusillum (strain Z07020 / HMAS-L-300199) TaxID=1263415 RepID=U1GGW9_ENDPU|nr:uncharacterized protein EPUS_03311 [Endocarpon pusillum Z07020]ERF71031.1 hypothetical protein EPUS_03311 [Endocarpon pusillum Z07020]
MLPSPDSLWSLPSHLPPSNHSDYVYSNGMITSYLRTGFTRLLRREHHPGCHDPPTHHGDLHHVYLKGSGPGGQKINKTNSAVQITHIPTGIVVKSQATRSRSQNYKIARQILAEKIEHLEKGGESRLSKKVEKTGTQKRSREKKARRKYRALEAAKNGQVEDDDRREPGSHAEAVREESGDPVACHGKNRSQEERKTREDNVGI